MKFNQSMTVKETIQTIQDKLKIKNEPNKKYGLFLCPPVGIWCNEDLPLRVYELEGFSEVEFLDLAKRDELMNDISTGFLFSFFSFFFSFILSLFVCSFPFSFGYF